MTSYAQQYEDPKTIQERQDQLVTLYQATKEIDPAKGMDLIDKVLVKAFHDD